MHISYIAMVADRHFCLGPTLVPRHAGTNLPTLILALKPVLEFCVIHSSDPWTTVLVTPEHVVQEGKVERCLKWPSSS